MYGLDYLFNEEVYYVPKEIKEAFDGSYVLYESKGDKDEFSYDYIKPKYEYKARLCYQKLFIC